MWKYCGVIKNESLLKKGIEEIERIEEKLNNVDVRIDKYNCDDLVLTFDLQSSLITAKTTILSALERKESRGRIKDLITQDFNHLINLIV